MNYENNFNRNNPGLIIFLVDQTEKSGDAYLDGRWMPQMFADYVNDSILEMIKKNINGIEIINRCFIAVIVYGSDNVCTLSEGYINDYLEYVVEKENEKLNVNVVEPKFGGFINVWDGFRFVEDYLESWKEYTIDSGYTMDHAPMIVHIGTGVYFDDVEAGYGCIRAINNIKFNDGSPIMINFIFNPWSMMHDCFDYCMTKDKGDIVQKSILDASSIVNPNLAANYMTYNLFKNHPEYRFFFVNSKTTPPELIANIFKL